MRVSWSFATDRFYVHELDPNRFGVGLAGLHLAVVPGERLDRPVLEILGVGVGLLQAAAEVVHEPQVGAAVALRLDRLVVPLEHPLGVGERTVLLGVRCGG